MLPSPRALSLFRVQLLTEVQFEPGDLIVRQGEPGETFYIVVEGSAMCSIADDSGGEVEVMRLGPFDYFGEPGEASGASRSWRRLE